MWRNLLRCFDLPQSAGEVTRLLQDTLERFPCPAGDAIRITIRRSVRNGAGYSWIRCNNSRPVTKIPSLQFFDSYTVYNCYSTVRVARASRQSCQSRFAFKPCLQMQAIVSITINYHEYQPIWFGNASKCS